MRFAGRAGRPRVALGALMVECNPRSPTAGMADFEINGYLVGEQLLEDLKRQHSMAPLELKAFSDEIVAILPDCDLIPLISADGGAAGPIEETIFEHMVEAILRPIQRAMPLDGVYLALHGAAITVKDYDAEASLLRRVRDVVGPDVPIVATLDLHANVSSRMVELADSLVIYRTNPHIDIAERGREAAGLIGKMIGGMKVCSAFVKLPLIAPSQTQLTDRSPLRDVMKFAQDQLRLPGILNVSIATGFVLADTPNCGMSVVVTSAGDKRSAKLIAVSVARRLWGQRDRFVLDLISIERAVAIALEAHENPASPPVIFADPNDNPGAAAPGNTVWLLSAFHRAGIGGCIIGGINDARLAAEAHRRGEGASFRAVFNRDVVDPLAGGFAADAVVERLHSGKCVGRRGMMAGRDLNLGPSCLLRIGGIRVLVISNRQQCYDPIFFEMVGVDLSKVRCAVVKSRGHFRAGFDEFFGPDQIYSVDAPGVAPQRLDALSLDNIPRPIYPIDPEANWDESYWLPQETTVILR